jgi:hypothetical protein
VNARARFVTLGVLFAVVLYAVFWLLMATRPQTWQLGYVPAVIAVMLAAQGASWRRKLLFAGATLGLVLLLYAIVAVCGLESGSSSLQTSQAATGPQVIAYLATKVAFLALPLAALAVFVGRRPAMLWTALPAEQR